MTSNFEYYTPTRVVFGRGAADRVGELMKAERASKVLIHYGGGSAVRSGLIGRIEHALDEAGIAHVKLGGVVPNPHLGKIREGIELALREGVDFLLAVGGGSVIDSAKAIAYGMAEPDLDVWELFLKKRTAKGACPLAAVLTIAAAGSEMSSSCVVTDESCGMKRSYDSDLSRPRFALMDPELTMTLPDYQTGSGCADIMMHTMERYFQNGETMEMTDSIAEGLMRTVMKHAEILHRDPMNYNSRAEVMWAGSLSHNGLTGCGSQARGDFVAHGLEHELGGMFDVTHGAGLAAVWPSWARYVCRDCLPRFVRFATRVMGVEPGASDEETALRGIEAMEAFYRRIGMPVNLKELGVEPTEEQILAMAASYAQACGGKKGTARLIYEEDAAAIFRMALPQ